MYSIVMMTALTAAPDAPQFGGSVRDLFRRDNAGCNGCSGGARYSCAGGGCSGAAAYSNSCSGCCGSASNGVFGLGLGDRVRSLFDRDSNSGCCGSHSYNCTGASFACSGYSCSGSAFSCFGGPAYSYTPAVNGGLSCMGGFPSPAPPPTFDPYPAPGFPGMNVPGVPGIPGVPFAAPEPAPGVGFRPAPTVQQAGALTANTPTARATVVVKLPADARLFADGRALNLTGAERKFVSPDLPTGQEFVYRFKAEYERGGETVSVTKKVPVQAGQTAAVEFVDLTAARPSAPAAGTSTAGGADKLDKNPVPPVTPVAPAPVKAEPPIKPAPAIDVPGAPGGDRATITVKLPPGATLYVDERKSPSADPVRSFSTPPLPAGREFAYLIKAEVLRDGRPETFTQKVPFRAGERVVVDFTSLAGK